jgi:hypothetical protein
MNPKEKLPLETNNMNSINFRPETTNPTAYTDKGNLTSKEAGNEVKKAVESFEQSLAEEGSFQ